MSVNEFIFYVKKKINPSVLRRASKNKDVIKEAKDIGIRKVDILEELEREISNWRVKGKLGHPFRYVVTTDDTVMTMLSFYTYLERNGYIEMTKPTNSEPGWKKDYWGI